MTFAFPPILADSTNLMRVRHTAMDTWNIVNLGNAPSTLNWEYFPYCLRRWCCQYIWNERASASVELFDISGLPGLSLLECMSLCPPLEWWWPAGRRPVIQDSMMITSGWRAWVAAAQQRSFHWQSSWDTVKVISIIVGTRRSDGLTIRLKVLTGPARVETHWPMCCVCVPHQVLPPINAHFSFDLVTWCPWTNLPITCGNRLWSRQIGPPRTVGPRTVRPWNCLGPNYLRM